MGPPRTALGSFAEEEIVQHLRGQLLDFLHSRGTSP